MSRRLSIPDREKKTRQWEDDSDLHALAAAINAGKPAEQRAAAVCDMLDVPQVINYIASGSHRHGVRRRLGQYVAVPRF